MIARYAPRSRKFLAVIMLGLVALPVGGCGRALRSVGLSAGEPGLADRCAEFMVRAFPGGAIKITGRQAAFDPAAGNFATAVARVEGVRPQLPEGGFVARDVAVECRFENDVLTSFRWTAGPVR